MSKKLEHQENTTIKNTGRRKAVKTIIGGVTAIAAYNILPTNWSKPVIDQIFLPAHAATSGISLHDPCTLEYLGIVGLNHEVLLSGYVTPPTGGVVINIRCAGQLIAGGEMIGTSTAVTAADGTYSQSWTAETAFYNRLNFTTSGPEISGTATCSIDLPAPGGGGLNASQIIKNSNKSIAKPPRPAID